MDPINPSVIALHGALVELTLRLGRVEDKLGMPPGPLATFARIPIPPPAPPPAQHAPHIDYTSGCDADTCGCDESVSLRAQVATLTARVRDLEGVRHVA